MTKIMIQPNGKKPPQPKVTVIDPPAELGRVSYVRVEQSEGKTRFIFSEVPRLGFKEVDRQKVGKNAGNFAFSGRGLSTPKGTQKARVFTVVEITD